MSRYCRQAPTAALAALVLAGCGTASQAGDTAVRAATVPVANGLPPIAQIQAWAVTVEPQGGVPQPTGAMVLKG